MSQPCCILAVIPAKMTSRRLLRKNLADLCGKPLLYFSIQVAKKVSLISDIYVSSEDEEVLNVAAFYGAIPINRPSKLSLPNITNKDVLRHSYEEAKIRNGISPELVVLLQPTHPLRNPKHIEKAITIMKRNPKYDSLFSVMKTDELRGQIKSNVFKPEFPLPRVKSDEPKMYKNTGSFYIFRPDNSFLTESFFGEKIYPFVLERSPYEIDIDYFSDLELARCLLKTYLSDFPYFKTG